MTLIPTPHATLVAERSARLLAHLADAPFDAVVALSTANVDYATGYRSMSGAVHGTSSVAAVVTGTRTVLAGPVADSAPAFDAGIGEDDFVAFGRFYFESAGSAATATRLVDEHPGAVEAIAAAVRRAGVAAATLGLDDAACPAPLRAALAAALPDVTWVDASAWLAGVRARKLPGEVALLARSARLAEAGIVAALAVARPGVTEAELARVVARTMVDGGGLPKFTVVTTGPRSALADAVATDRPLAAGDLLRFDVGCLLDGYWSDIGRTAVVGAPTDLQARRYDAILAGLDAQLAAARPGVSAVSLFDLAVDVTERGGLAPYRRQHCGHGIGLDVYEAPIVRPGEDVPLEEGMTFCFETPYYELGWGGMMVEDALVVTTDGVQPLTTLARGLTEVPA
ncbi:M24 family metallopeptidase [Cellulomonas sp. Marseille-Q8402]